MENLLNLGLLPSYLLFVQEDLILNKETEHQYHHLGLQLVLVLASVSYLTWGKVGLFPRGELMTDMWPRWTKFSFLPKRYKFLKPICLFSHLRTLSSFLQLAAPESHLLVSSSLDKTLRIWDLRKWAKQSSQFFFCKFTCNNNGFVFCGKTGAGHQSLLLLKDTAMVFQVSPSGGKTLSPSQETTLGFSRYQSLKTR